MKHDETRKRRPEVAVPVAAVGTEAASRALAGVRGHAVLLLSKLTSMLNALKKNFFLRRKYLRNLQAIRAQTCGVGS